MEVRPFLAYSLVVAAFNAALIVFALVPFSPETSEIIFLEWVTVALAVVALAFISYGAGLERESAHWLERGFLMTGIAGTFATLSFISISEDSPGIKAAFIMFMASGTLAGYVGWVVSRSITDRSLSGDGDKKPGGSRTTPPPS